MRVIGSPSVTSLLSSSFPDNTNKGWDWVPGRLVHTLAQDSWYVTYFFIQIDAASSVGFLSGWFLCPSDITQFSVGFLSIPCFLYCSRHKASMPSPNAARNQVWAETSLPAVMLPAPLVSSLCL